MKRLTPSQLLTAATRSLVIDMINKANSGHPGMGLDAAPILAALYRDHLVADPRHPGWINRDRFVLSSGHASSLLYATLHLCGYDLSLDDLKSFRQLGSKTPGHPEIGVTPGVDATSGPLGQGVAQAVGMAIAEKALAAQYEDVPGAINHYTYCLCGDGCLEEGIAQEAISLAGHQHLNKLILFYDRNGSTLDGPTSDSLTENVKLRFLACEWNVLEVKDGNDLDAISKAIAKAKKSKVYPTLIIVNSIIGFGSKNQGSHKTHGSPLGEEDGAYAKAAYGYEYPEWTVPQEVYDMYANTFVKRGEAAYEDYQKKQGDLVESKPMELKGFLDAIDGKPLSYVSPVGNPESGKEATRVSSGRLLSDYAANNKTLFGGSADVASSTNTNGKGMVMFTPEHPEGRDMHYGIREFAMAAVNNGILLHGGLRTYCACFAVFADYMKPAIRMAALQELPSVYLFTHDSLAVGEDGPTHQPIEQLPMLRAIPGLEVYRPADLNETKGAYEAGFGTTNHPTAIVLSRQALPCLENSSSEFTKRGGYLILNPSNPDCEILASGSEVSLALEAAKILEEKGINAAVASLPNPTLFEKQGSTYRGKVLVCEREKRISLEMGSTLGWGDLAAFHIGVDRFGASGKAGDVLAEYGFTPEKVASKIASLLKRK